MQSYKPEAYYYVGAPLLASGPDYTHKNSICNTVTTKIEPLLLHHVLLDGAAAETKSTHLTLWKLSFLQLVQDLV